MNMTDCAPNLGERVTQFGERAEGTSLYLLRAVEGAVRSMTVVCEMARADAKEADRLRKFISELTGNKEIDPDDRAVEALSRVLDSMRRLHGALVSKRASALADPELKKSGHRDTVVEAFDEALSCVDGAFESMSELRNAIMEFDADRSESVGPFESVDDLMAALQ